VAPRALLAGSSPATTEVRAANNVTASCVSDRIYWSELGVTVQSAGLTHWTGRSGHYTTDISCAGSRPVLVRHDGSAGGFAADPQPP
jgi:hypothetical protein